MPRVSNKVKEQQKQRGKTFKWVAWGLTYVILNNWLWPFGVLKWFLVLPIAGVLGKIAEGIGEGIDTSKNLKKSNKQLIQEEVERQKAEEERKANIQQKSDELQEQIQKQRKKRSRPAKPYKSTGVQEVDELLDSGFDMLNDMNKHKEAIADIDFSNSIDSLETKIIRILKEVERDPRDASKARKFMNYYLPTTIKMIEKYSEIEHSQLSGQNAIYAKQKIIDAVEVVKKACDKQLDMLYQDDLLDITTDIQAMEQMLKRDGLIETEWDQIQKQNNTQGAN